MEAGELGADYSLLEHFYPLTAKTPEAMKNGGCPNPISRVVADIYGLALCGDRWYHPGNCAPLVQGWSGFYRGDTAVWNHPEGPNGRCKFNKSIAMSQRLKKP